ncbi:ARID DNA-binding domain-containing protein, partial [Tanacetum coccineum]
GFFDLVPWLKGLHGVLIEKGVKASFKGRWKDRKSNFKKHEFVLRDGYKEPIKIKDFPPTDVKIEECRKLCDHFTLEKHLKRSRSCRVNRSKLLYSSNQGTKSYAQSRYEEFNEETGEFPDLIDHFRVKHIKGAGKWNHPVAEERYNKMIELREAQEGRDTPLTIDQIMSQVLGESRGFLPGRGRRLPNSAYASSSCSAHSDPPAPLMVPVPTLLNPNQFTDVVRDPPEDDAAPGDDVASGHDVALGDE